MTDKPADIPAEVRAFLDTLTLQEVTLVRNGAHDLVRMTARELVPTEWLPLDEWTRARLDELRAAMKRAAQLDLYLAERETKV